MQKDSELFQAYCAARRKQWVSWVATRRPNYAGYGNPVESLGEAQKAIALARQNMAAGKKSYCSSPFPYVETTAAGLRYVGRVDPEPRGRNRNVRPSNSGGWFTDPHGDVFRDGSGLCFGVVYQLPGRNGRARYVAGFQFGGTDGGPDLDFKTIRESDAGDWSMDTPDALHDATRDADSMAESAAEKEREYQTAWQAGSRWSDLKEQVSTLRKHTLELLAEMKPFRRPGLGKTSPVAICNTLRAAIAGNLKDISDARKDMNELAAGDYSKGDFYLGFYPSEKLRAAFNDGASENVI